MPRSFALKFTIIFFLSGILFAQEKYSIQFTGGIISPVSSSRGIIGLVQFTYPVSEKIDLYLNSGYSKWDQFKVNFHEDLSQNQSKDRFQTYIADNHSMIPISIGVKFLRHSNEFFKTYLSFEMGYSYLKYNSYSAVLKEIDSETGEVLNYFPDQSTKKLSSENLWGLGLAVTFLRPLTENFNLLLNVKLNTNTGSKINGFLSSKGTFASFSAGVDFVI